MFKSSVVVVKSPFDWLKELPFYIYGFIYMLVRIAVNGTMTV